MNKPQLPEMPPENSPQPVVPSLAGLIVYRICAGLLLGMIFVALFGDFVVWAVYGTGFMLSPRFHKLTPMFLGFGVLLIYIFMWQAYTLRKQGKTHLALLEFLAFLAGGLPAGLFCALLLRLFTAKGVAVMMHPKIALLTALLLLIFACKRRAFSIVWQLVKSAFEAQDERRIVISK